MDRRTFLKIFASLGASIALPVDLAAASQDEIDSLWIEAVRTLDLFQVSEFGTLSYANFEEPQTRYDAHGYSNVGDVDASIVESHAAMYEPIQEIYRDHLREQNPLLDDTAIEELVEDSWLEWFMADGRNWSAIEGIIDDWLSDAPDRCQEWEDYYKTGDAQGAAYDHFLREDSELMDELGIAVIEGQCPGSSYFAAELHTPVEEANRIAAERGRSIRFVYEGEDFVRYDGKPRV
ncbi:MAG: hypothetical protein ROZ37_01290 [Aromatoleum sp.]|jgi:hypothetical protein|uniref:hypothetical protein n=1 Tax=Aromatoleum sp. TaxID=2307007 RepID=UPI00289619E9|nr:hypothetical protein [Aromatoleum sp.]MDT3668950.1 hypothetical protein [Aromatoleum sp.]